MKTLTKSTAELDISRNEASRNFDHKSAAAGKDAVPDPSGLPSHPNLEILSPDGARVEDGDVEDGQAEEADGAGPDPGAGSKKRKKRAKGKRATVGAIHPG